MIKSNQLIETRKVLQKSSRQEFDYKCFSTQSYIVFLITHKRITQFPNNNFYNISKQVNEESIGENRCIMK